MKIKAQRKQFVYGALVVVYRIFCLIKKNVMRKILWQSAKRK